MTNITFTEFAAMSLEPIKRAFWRWFLDMQISMNDDHDESLQKSIDNDLEAKRVLANERINLVARRSGLR